MIHRMNVVFKPAVWLVLTAGVLLVAWYVISPKAVVAEPLSAVPAEEPPAVDAALPEPTSVSAPDVVVYVTGAVARPGLYALASTDRVGAAVAAAGGMTQDAAYDTVNMAEHLVDAQHIHIPFESEPVSAPVGSSDAPASASASLVAINTASVADLTQLPGIGTSIAERIIAYRTAHGPFRSLADLDAVSGIGSALLERLAPFLRF